MGIVNFVVLRREWKKLIFWATGSRISSPDVQMEGFTLVGHILQLCDQPSFEVYLM